MVGAKIVSITKGTSNDIDIMQRYTHGVELNIDKPQEYPPDIFIQLDNGLSLHIGVSSYGFINTFKDGDE